MKIKDPVTDEELLEMIEKGDRYGLIEMTPEQVSQAEEIARENFAQLSDEKNGNLTFGKFLELAYP